MVVPKWKPLAPSVFLLLGLMPLWGFGVLAKAQNPSRRLLLQANLTQEATVSHVIDGDTIKIHGDDRAIQLGCINTPDQGEEPFWKDAKVRLAGILPVNQRISVRITPQLQDKWQRPVVEIYKQGKSVNLQMVREGKAVIYNRHTSNCAASAKSYRSAESAARNAGLGVWNRTNPWSRAANHD